MKKKDKKNLAERIAKLTLVIENSNDSTKVKKAKEEILKLSAKIENLEDILEIDAYVQDYLEKNS